MIYKINNTDVSEFGAFPVLSGERIAISGIFDCPKRSNPTERSWDTEIEPFVDDEDIILEARTISMSFALPKTANLTTFKEALVQTTVLTVENVNFNVLLRSDIDVKEVGIYYILKTVFYSETITLPALPIASGTGSIRIDNYNLHDQFGIHSNKDGGFYSLGKALDVNTSETYTNTQYRDFRELSINCFIVGTSFSDLLNKMSLFQALLYKPGMRELYIDGKSYSCYHKAGFKAQVVAENLIKFTLKLSTND